jgi:WD40 repeat protein
MTPHLTCLVAVAVTAGAAPPPREPLPEGARARLGTTHLRALCDSLHYSPDGKTLVGVNGGSHVRVWDAGTGRLLDARRLPGRPDRDRWAVRVSRSPDGQTLLLREGASWELWDLPSRKRLTVLFPDRRRRVDRVALSDDRRLLLFSETVRSLHVPAGGGFGHFVQEQNLVLWDTRTGKARLLAGDELQLVALAISPGNKRLASSSYYHGKGTCVWERATGKLLWREPKFNAEQVTFSPDGRLLLAAPGGGQSAWHVWDAATGRPAPGYRPPTVGYAWMFALSPDGGKLLIPTSEDYVLWDYPFQRVRSQSFRLAQL